MNIMEKRFCSQIRELLICPKCNCNSLNYKEYDDSDLNNLKGRIICPKCLFVISVESGVLIGYGPEELSKIDKRNQVVYKETWLKGHEAYKKENFTIESDLIDSWGNYFNNNIMLDMGCGAGRLLDTWSKFNINTIVFIDISDAIFQCRENYLKTYKDKFNAIFIKASIKNLPIRNETIDTTWCAGVISCINDQTKALNEVLRVTKHNVILSVVTKKTFIGKIYIQLNIVKPILNRINNLNLLFKLAGLLAYLAYICIKVINNFNRSESKQDLDKILNCDKPISRLQFTLFDPLTVPICRNFSDDFYINLALQRKFSLRSLTTSSLCDYFIFCR